MRWKHAVVVCTLSTAAALGVAQAQLVRSGSSDVSFTAVGPAGLTIVGKTSELTIAHPGQTITLGVPLSTLTTGIALRDRHMKEKYLEVQKYPDAELQVARSALKIPEAGREASSDAMGTLKLHGQTRPAKFHYTTKRNGNNYAVQGSMRLNMQDYGISVPSYLGITVKPDVDVAVRFDAVDKQ
jgi:polyisoprenoid-binding protein YceI